MDDVTKLKTVVKDHERRISKLESSLKISQGKHRKVSGKRKSITDFLEELKEEKFFNQPRTAREIVNKLAEATHHYPIKSLSWPLQQAVRNRMLGRVKRNKKWAWVKR